MSDYENKTCEICGDKAGARMWNKQEASKNSSMRFMGNGMMVMEENRNYRYCCKEHIGALTDKLKEEMGIK
jgi:hypothetical protein